MLVQGGGLVAAPRLPAHRHPRDPSSAMGLVTPRCFIEGEDQEAAPLEIGTRDQRGHVGPKPLVRRVEAAAVRVVAQVRHDERVVRQRLVGEVAGELRERHQPLALQRVVHDVRQVGQGIVPPGVGAGAVPRVAHGRQILGVRLPRLPRGDQASHDVVPRHGPREIVVVGDRVADGEHEVVSDGRVGVGVVLRGETIPLREAVQVRHRRAADHVRVVVVLFHHDEDVVKARRRVGTHEWLGGEEQQPRAEDARAVHGSASLMILATTCVASK